MPGNRATLFALRRRRRASGGESVTEVDRRTGPGGRRPGADARRGAEQGGSGNPRRVSTGGHDAGWVGKRRNLSVAALACVAVAGNASLKPPDYGSEPRLASRSAARVARGVGIGRGAGSRLGCITGRDGVTIAGCDGVAITGRRVVDDVCGGKVPPWRGRRSSMLRHGGCGRSGWPPPSWLSSWWWPPPGRWLG